jgi:FkbM family methyltransferase
LEQNVIANGLGSSVKVLETGLGSAASEVFIQLERNRPHRTGTANILPATFEFEKIPLRIERLDSLVASGQITGPIRLMKIDTDGYDLEVLKGATSVLNEQRPLIIAELEPVCLAWHGQTIEDVITFLDGQNYELRIRVNDDWKTFERYQPPKKFVRDALVLPKERAAGVAARLKESRG